jgi:ketosteroid isomerase-like protein
MASANVELVRSIHAAWERGDYSSAEWADPAIEYVIVGGPSPGRWVGLAGMAEAWRGWLNAWEGYRGEAEEYRDLDGERVLVLSRFHGRGKLSGVELGQMGAKGASVYHIRDGKVTRIVIYFDRDRTFADLGLPPETSPQRS